MNITDVGHLTGDTDAGDDKLEATAACRKNQWKRSRNFILMHFLRPRKAEHHKAGHCRARERDVREEIALVEMLFEKGFAYDTPKAVYFDVSKFSAYGALSGQSLAEKMTGARDEVVVDDEQT